MQLPSHEDNLSHSVMTGSEGESSFYLSKPVKNSLNSINPDYKNVYRLFKDALMKIKEDIICKKIEVSNPKLATDNSIAIENIAFEPGMFKRILDIMGLNLSFTQ